MRTHIAEFATVMAALELVPRAQDRVETWIPALAVVAGALASVGLAHVALLFKRKMTNGTSRATTWGVRRDWRRPVHRWADDGSGPAIAADLGLLPALSQVLGKMPGGFAIAANFRKAGVSRTKRFGAMAVYPVMPVAGAAIGYLVLQRAGDLLVSLALALFAGLLLTATVKDIIPEADVPGTARRISNPSSAAGFVILLLMSAYLGG